MKQRGSILILAIVFTGIFLIIVVGLLQYVTTLNKSSVAEQDRERAFEISESGIDHYQWLFTHNPTDYCDGNTPCPSQATHGPYTHEYRDPAGDVIGHYDLYIDEPALGSTIATVRSTGYLDSDPSYQRTIEARLGIPSLANFLFLCNSNMAFASNSHTYGNIHSNGGIRFDGTNEGIVQSALTTYWCQPIHGCSPPTQHDGVWGTGGPQDLWRTGVGEVVFANYLSSFTELKNLSQPAQGGYYLPPSGRRGYHLTLQSNGTILIRRVRTASTSIGITHEEDYSPPSISIPSNGVLFVEDNVWIDGTLNGRLTIAAAEFPVETGDVNVIINDNITYHNGMGQDALGIIAQHDIELGRWLPTDTIIYATMFAQDGKIYRDVSDSTIKNSLHIYGGLIYNEVGYFKRVWHDWVVSGYTNTYYHFDASLTYGPPPHWPTLGSYQMIDWREL